MKRIINITTDEERAFYAEEDIIALNCTIDGEGDGESAFKECQRISVCDSLFNLRYPFWHNDVLSIDSCNLTEQCRAPLWYSRNIEIKNTHLGGTKALRECEHVKICDSKIISDEFGWFCNDITVCNTSAVGEYFMLCTSGVVCKNITFNGKYSFQYVDDGKIEKCVLNTKDALWHSKNITVTDCEINGEYLAWYSEGLTLVNCKMSGTQPFCYCKNLTLIDCTMTNCDLSFEKSDVNATIIGTVTSIKNLKSGKIICDGCEIICDDLAACGNIIIRK